MVGLGLGPMVSISKSFFYHSVPIFESEGLLPRHTKNMSDILAKDPFEQAMLTEKSIRC